jgi:1-acyl-sn-glycerol-3-phosphate acyltransferase
VDLGQTVILAILLGTQVKIAARGGGFSWAILSYWGRSNRFFLRWIVSIRTRVTGAEHVPDGPCIIAAKHMSDWDIFAILPHAKRPAFVAKKELMDIPFFGWAAKSFDAIRIDRSRGGNASPLMLDEARGALDRGCRIIIFPEGSRRAPLAAPDYRYGIVRMYAALDVPVVPVALNSGLFWGRQSPMLWPGTAEARFLPPIPPGLTETEFPARLSETIESATNALIVEAYDRGLSRPIPPDLREKLDAAKAGNPARSAADPTIS